MEGAGLCMGVCGHKEPFVKSGNDSILDGFDRAMRTCYDSHREHGILSGLHRGEKKCIGPKAEAAVFAVKTFSST